MNYLAGRGLDARLAEASGPLPLEQVISIVGQVAEALDYIHRRGSVHRDVKPANVMVSDEGQATLLDFGIVRAADGTPLTTFGEKMGTPQYMSPEQAEGREVDHRSDVYALGVVAYEMLVGRPPFTGKSPTAILHKQVYEPPPAPTTLNPDLPTSLASPLLKVLAKAPAERFQRAGAFAAELRQVLLAESQMRQREAQLTPLYARFRAAAEREDWAEVLALGGQIQMLDADYRDVPDLMERARRWQPPVPAWVWPVGGAVVIGLVVVFLGSVFSDGWTPTPTPTLTRAPTVTPTGTPTREPTHTPAPIRESSGLLAGEPWTRPADGMVMVYVPGGTFQMGSDDDEVDDVMIEIKARRSL